MDVPERAVLFNRLAAPPLIPPVQLTPPQNQISLSEEEERIDDGIGFMWLMLSIAAKTLAREPASDMSLMLYPRSGLEDAASLLGFVLPSIGLCPRALRTKWNVCAIW